MDGWTEADGRGRWTMDREWSVGAGNCIRLHLNKDGSVQWLSKEGARNTALSFIELEIIPKGNHKSMPSN